jgi:cytochrome c oxidase assembly protein subunit 15
MPASNYRPWLHRFALLTAVLTFGLIGIGGLVTSHEAGLSVPDWPTSYGYNMFLFPLARWWHVGNIFYEHSHRLFASGVGMLTTILAVWLWRADQRRWMRWLGVAAFLGVVLQGVLGGLRVILFKDQIGIFHATLAQLFFLLVSAIALFTSRWWMNTNVLELSSDLRTTRRFGLAVTLLIFCQLVLGATMRHQHAGLAIPDFPLAYGRLWPAMDANSVARYNAQRMELTETNPITALGIGLQMAHRFMALLIAAGVGIVAWKARKLSAHANPLRRLSLVWAGLILAQITLGAFTTWTNKAADVATLHVLVGALSLVTGGLWCIIGFGRFAVQAREHSVDGEYSAPAGATLAAGR